jgi:hypothetical protein
MTIKVHVEMSIGLVGTDRHAILEFEDDATDEQIEDECSEWKNEQVEWSWNRVTDEEIAILQRKREGL